MGYDQVQDGEWTTYDWRGNTEMCCDCDLIHTINYRLRLVKEWPYLKVQQQSYREDKTTDRYRRYKSYKGTKGIKKKTKAGR